MHTSFIRRAARKLAISMHLILLLVLLASTFSFRPPTQTGLAAAQVSATYQGLYFDGVNDYVTFGAAPGLGAAQFTLEVWFRKLGAGVTANTGTGGVNAVPLLTKGRGEADGGTNVDTNYFMGLDASGRLVADFEEGAGGASPSLNHPITGVRAISDSLWHHAAATYDGTTWRLYLDGILENSLVVGQPPRSDSIQHAALGTALTSTNVPEGYFNGLLDEARVWSYARSQAEIQTAMNSELSLPQTGLLGYWKLNDASGSTATDSSGSGINGTLTNGPIWGVGFGDLSTGLYFDGTNDYVTFGAAPGLGAAQFTLEGWVRKLGAGATTGTGTGGLAAAVPLITKGRGEADGSNLDMNYFLGLDTIGRLVVDFEEGATGASPGLNHPFTGSTVVSSGVWHHVAATYDGTSWRLYLDGALDGTLNVGRPPRADSIQHAALGTALTSTGAAAGYFNGVLDDVRIWNYARSQAEIQAAMNNELSLPQAGLLGYWKLNETSGTTANDSSGSGINGTLTNGPRVFPGMITDLISPAAPTGLAFSAVYDGRFDLSWNASPESDLAGYQLYRSLASPVDTSGAPINGASLLTSTSFADGGLQNGVTYYYALVAVDQSGNRSAASTEISGAPSASSGAALLLNGTSQYVTFGNPAKLHLPVFTLEAWFRVDGAGATTTTGTGGVTSAVPILARGRGESESAAVDTNFFLGIDASLGVLAADFEEGPTGASPSLNHPVRGVTVVTDGAWHHAAAAYDGATWRLFLDGKLESELFVGQPTAAQGNQPASIGSALTSTNVAAGFFRGAIDEVRIWSRSLSQDEINLTMNESNMDSLLALADGMVARWGLDDSGGSTVHDSETNPVDAPNAWPGQIGTAGAPFNLNHTPLLPVLVAPADGAGGVANPATLAVQVGDYDVQELTVTFNGRPVLPPGPSFTLAVLPDSQYYTVNAGGATIFNSQTQWVVNNQSVVGIPYVAHVGDVTENGDNDTDEREWLIADAAFQILENAALPVPFGISGGNHDYTGGSTLYQKWFGVDRFTGTPYYGGAYPDATPPTNRNYYTTFSAGGMDFVVLNLDSTVTPSTDLLNWAGGILAANPGKRAIVVSHNLLSNAANPASFSTSGSTIYNALKVYPNLFLMLCGHVPGEGFRQDTYNGSTVYTILSDYQSNTNGGDGWMRLLRFVPSESMIYVSRYSPYNGQTIADQLALSYDMTAGMASVQAFTPLGQVSGVAPGGTAQLTTGKLDANVQYEWYVSVDDGQSQRTGPVWSFTPQEPTAIELTRLKVGSESSLPWLVLIPGFAALLVCLWAGGMRRGQFWR